MNAIIKENKELQQFIQEKIDEFSIFAERDFVSQVKAYTSSSIKQVLLITGLRSTGKTIGALQGIETEDAIYISPVYKGSVSEIEILNFLEKNSHKTIIIDEFGWIDGIEKLPSYLGNIVDNGIRVIITGTESAIIHGLKNTGLIHRALEIHTTYFSYEEYCRLYGVQKNPATLDNYLSRGGILNLDITGSDSALRDFIKTSILDNFTSYYPEYDADQVKLAVYTCFYNCIINSIEIERMEKVPVYPFGNTMFYEDYLNHFGIRTDIVMDKDIFREIVSQMDRLKIVIPVENLRNPLQKRYYITNQAITCQLIRAIYGENVLDSSRRGYIFEASVVCNAYYHKNNDCAIKYLYTRKHGRELEIDFILIENKEAYLFECKHSSGTQNNQLVVATSSLVMDTIPLLLGNYDISIMGRYVIYAGEPKYQCINEKDVVFTDDWNIVSGNYRKFDWYVKILTEPSGGNGGDNPEEITDNYDPRTDD